jgi:hypothetical protein
VIAAGIAVEHDQARSAQLREMVVRRRPGEPDFFGELGEGSLDADHIARLDAAGRPQLGFQRGFLESSNVRELIYGNTFEKLRT